MQEPIPDPSAPFRATPRRLEEAPHLRAQMRKAYIVVLLTALASIVVGISFSFVRFRGSAPWEPHNMIVASAILAAFTVPIAMVFPLLLRRYVKLYRHGRCVPAVVIETRPHGCVVEVGVEVGPNRSYLHDARLAVGTSVPTFVGDIYSSLVLAMVGPTFIRGSLLTQAQVAGMGYVAARP